ncbi:MAG: hypothetical protein QMO91_05545 [Candidatus Tisiphia sp.]|nr:hypothetical protein [Candidatus Tisiphia sp.]
MNMFNTLDQDVQLNIEQVKWREVRDVVHRCNPTLAEKCDNINKDAEYPLFKMYYPYGAFIVDKGEFYLPTLDGKTISIEDKCIPPILKTNLGYSQIPLSLIIDKASEVFVEAQNRVISLNFLNIGEMFGLFELMNLFGLGSQHSSLNTPIWNISAGARSTFMIPSISDMISHTRIKKKFGKDIHVPCNITDHWQTFVDIHKYNCNTKSWYNTVLVFSSGWFLDKNNHAYIELYKYLVSKCWQQFQLLEDFTEFSLLWSFFIHAISKRNLKPRPYLIDTIKHLILIAKDLGIAFKPTMNDTALPMSLIQQVYKDDYRLKDYIPTIMQPTKLTKESRVYYSLSYPNLRDSSPYLKNPPRIIEDQREIKKLLDILINIIHQIDTLNTNSLKNINFELFHSNNDPFGQILPSRTIPETDSRFLESASNEDKRLFCSSSSFFNGCIAIYTTNLT